MVIYLLVQPLIMLKLSPWLPAWLTTCSSIRFFGRPCPLCGITRGIDALLHGRIEEAATCNMLSLPVLILLVMELFYRMFASFIPVPERVLPFIIRWDRRLHVALVAGYLVCMSWYVMG